VDYQNLSVLFYTKTIEGLTEFGITDSDKPILQEAYTAIAKKDNETLAKLLANTNLKVLAQNLLSPDFEKYLLAQIPKQNNLEYKNVGVAAHGPSIAGLTGNEAFKLLTSTTTEKNGTRSSLGNIYNSYVTKANI